MHRFLKKAVLPMLAMCLAATTAAAKPPNVLIILADDMGFSDAACYGGEIQTPNIDHLAAHGLRFTQGYSTGRCWPSRAAILTGYYPQQVRRDALPGVKIGDRPEWARLLPEMLKAQGYRSYHSGKWHLDGKPLENGFERSYRMNDHDRFFSPKRHELDDAPQPAVEPDSDYYVTTAIADHAIACLKEHAEDHANTPFFQYLAFTCPHFPLHALQKDIDKYRDCYLAGWEAVRRKRLRRMQAMTIVDCELSSREEAIRPPWNLSDEELEAKIGPGEAGWAVAWDTLTDEQKAFQAAKMAIHAAMVDRMDQEIGRVLGQLRAMDAYENTIIFFLSDNGASAEQIIRGDEHDPRAVPGSAASYLCLGPGFSTAANTPLRLHKYWVHEGGISSPWIVHWPTGIRGKGELRHDVVHFVDLVPTILELAGGEAPSMWCGQSVPSPPGMSITEAFERDGAVNHEFLFFSHSGNKAIRQGDWKLVAGQGKEAWQLYNIEEDRGESDDLAAEHPGKVQDMAAIWDDCIQEYLKHAMRDTP